MSAGDSRGGAAAGAAAAGASGASASTGTSSTNVAWLSRVTRKRTNAAAAGGARSSLVSMPAMTTTTTTTNAKYASASTSGASSSLSTSASASASTSSSSSVTLSTTLSQFGGVSFDLRRYLETIYAQTPVSHVSSHKHELELRKQQTQTELRRYVTHHYPSFIETSKEISNIESDLVQFSTLLHSLSHTLKQVSECRFTYDDEARMAITADAMQQEQEAAGRSETVNSGSAGKSTASATASSATASASRYAFGDSIGLEEWSEDVRTLIYERKFDHAVRLIDAAARALGNHSNATSASSSTTTTAITKPGTAAPHTVTGQRAVSALRTELSTRLAQLVDTLLFELQSPSLKRAQRRAIIKHLVYLGHAEQARDLYLQSRTDALRASVRSLRFQGDTVVYVQSLSNLFFAHIAGTCVDCCKLFPAASHVSTLMVWATHELETYGLIVAKQLFHSEADFVKVGKCLRIAFAGCAQLESKGLSLSFVLADMFSPPLFELVQKNYEQVENDLFDQVEAETWRVGELWVSDAQTKRGAAAATAPSSSSSASRHRRSLKLTPSARFLYDCVRSLLNDLTPLLAPSPFYPSLKLLLYPNLVQGMISVLENYLLAMAGAAKHGIARFDDTQALSIVANAFYLADDLLPRVAREFRRQFDRAIPELEALGQKLSRLYEALQESYCQRRVEAVWVEQYVQFDRLLHDAYQAPAIDPARTVRPEWLRLNAYLVDLRRVIRQCMNVGAVEPVLSACLEEFGMALYDRLHLDHAGGGSATTTTTTTMITFGLGGLVQFHRDLQFLLASAGEALVTPRLRELASTMQTLTAQMYAQQVRGREADVQRELAHVEDEAKQCIERWTAEAQRRVASNSSSPPFCALSTVVQAV